MTYELTHESYGAQISRAGIERGEAINRLIVRGVLPDRAVSLLEVLPAGLGITYHDELGDKITILRTG